MLLVFALPLVSVLALGSTQGAQAAATATSTTITNGLGLLVPTVVGQAYTVKSTVAPTSGTGTPTGLVTISGDAAGCSATLVNGQGQCDILAPTAAGLKWLKASYAGDSNFAASASVGTAHLVNPAATKVQVTNGVDLATKTVSGQTYTVKWTVNAVAPGAGTPTGTVVILGDGVCSAQLALGAGQCTMTSGPAGAKSLLATYFGDANFGGSISTAVPHTVDKAATQTEISNAADLLANPTQPGAAFTVKWNVPVTLPGAGAPTGSVVVTVNGSFGCSAAVTAKQCDVFAWFAGDENVVAKYSGDASFLASTSTSVLHKVQAVTKPTTTQITNGTELATPTLPIQGYPVKWAVNFNPASSEILSGTVVVKVDGAFGCFALVGAGQCTVVSWTAGVKSITAEYSGFGDAAPSKSDAVSHPVRTATSTSITNGSELLFSPAAAGQPVVVRWSVTPLSPPPTTMGGKVTVTVAGATDTCSADVAVGFCTIPAPPSGWEFLTASYSGDANFAPSSSGVALHIVTP